MLGMIYKVVTVYLPKFAAKELINLQKLINALTIKNRHNKEYIIYRKKIEKIGPHKGAVGQAYPLNGPNGLLVDSGKGS